jgi:hypothetical protein
MIQNTIFALLCDSRGKDKEMDDWPVQMDAKSGSEQQYFVFVRNRFPRNSK